MIEYVLAIVLLPLLLLGWVGVQRAWRRQFGAPHDEDVLAMRGDCGNCSCRGPCERKMG